MTNPLTASSIRRVNRSGRSNHEVSEDVVPLTDLKLSPTRIVKQVAESRRPVLLTHRGRGVAVMQSVAEFEAADEERAFMRAVVEGLSDLDAGRERL